MVTGFSRKQAPVVQELESQYVEFEDDLTPLPQKQVFMVLPFHNPEELERILNSGGGWDVFQILATASPNQIAMVVLDKWVNNDQEPKQTDSEG